MVNGINASDPCEINKGRGLKFCVGSWTRPYDVSAETLGIQWYYICHVNALLIVLLKINKADCILYSANSLGKGMNLFSPNDE